MKRAFMFCMLFMLASQFASAQNREFGIRLFPFSSGKQGYSDPGNYSNSARSFPGYLAADIYYAKINSNTSLRRIRAGFTLSNSNYISDARQMGILSHDEDKKRELSFSIAPGIGKSFVWNRFQAQIGAELPVRFLLGSRENRNIVFTDTSGTWLRTFSETRKKPAGIQAGIGIFANLYYRIGKKLYVGMEISNSVSFLFRSGRDAVYSSQFSSVPVENTQNGTSRNIQDLIFSGDFMQMSLGLKYCFGK